MNIGNNYADNKLYRGVKVGNNLPLLAEDLLEISDTTSNKNKYLLDSILGSGLIKEVDISYDTVGVKLRTPAVLNIEGDICLVKNSSDRYLVHLSDMHSTTTCNGIVCVVGWYQHLTASSTMKEYGGVSNKDLPNDLMHEDLNIQVSTRYQFRWDIAIVHESDKDNISSVQFVQKDAHGNAASSNIVLNNLTKKDSIYITDPPASMNYVVDKIYIIPLLEYTNIESSQQLESIKNVNIRRPNSTGNVIKSNTTPTGRFYDGQEWFNPDTLEFKTYIENVGFVANTTKTGFVRYQESFTIPTDETMTTNLTNLPLIEDTDILEVIYEGLQLSRGVDFNITNEGSNPSIDWLIPVKSQEKFVVHLTRLIEASNVTSLTKDFTKHINQSSSSVLEGHVKLSDSITSDSNASAGIAATPKAVKDSKIYKDATSGKSYKFTVENGTLYIVNTTTNAKTLLINGLL